MESGGVPKTCCICGAACPDTPPMRDPLRRVMCVKCSAAGAKLPPVREAAPAAPESGLIGLENIGPDELERLMEAEAAAAGSAATLAPSPPPASTGQGRKCPYCKCDLRGIRSVHCPECGRVAVFKDSKNRLTAVNEVEHAEVIRQAYKRAIIMLPAGLLLLALVRLVQHDPDRLLADLKTWCIATPVGIGVYGACGVLFLGFDAPARLTLLSLAGIYAVLDAFLALFLPQAFCFMTIPSCMYVFALPALAVALLAYLLHNQLDLEITEAGIVAILSSVVTVVIVLFARRVGIL